MFSDSVIGAIAGSSETRRACCTSGNAQPNRPQSDEPASSAAPPAGRHIAGRATTSGKATIRTAKKMARYRSRGQRSAAKPPNWLPMKLDAPTEAERRRAYRRRCSAPNSIRRPETCVDGERADQRETGERQQSEDVGRRATARRSAKPTAAIPLRRGAGSATPTAASAASAATPTKVARQLRDAATRRAGRHADDGRERHAGVDQRDRAAAPLGRMDRGGEGDRRGHERAGRQRQQHPRRGEPGETRRERREHDWRAAKATIATSQQPLALQAGRGDRQQRRAEGVGEREHRHQRARVAGET